MRRVTLNYLGMYSITGMKEKQYRNPTEMYFWESCYSEMEIYYSNEIISLCSLSAIVIHFHSITQMPHTNIWTTNVFQN